jgi:hypothetical protein
MYSIYFNLHPNYNELRQIHWWVENLLVSSLILHFISHSSQNKFSCCLSCEPISFRAKHCLQHYFFMDNYSSYKYSRIHSSWHCHTNEQEWNVYILHFQRRWKLSRSVSSNFLHQLISSSANIYIHSLLYDAITIVEKQHIIFIGIKARQKKNYATRSYNCRDFRCTLVSNSAGIIIEESQCLPNYTFNLGTSNNCTHSRIRIILCKSLALCFLIGEFS